MSLFKFKSANSIDDFNRDIQTMRENKIWFSGVINLNDPFEKVYSTKTLDGYDGTEEIVTELFNPFRKNVDEYFEKVGILSLCGENTNLVMWSHYADNHKGHCIEYNLNSEEINNLNFEKEDEIFLFEVEYNNSPIDFLSFPSNFQFYLRRKSSLWNYEKEFRFISSKSGLHKIPRKSIKAIYLGASANNLVKTALFDLCKERSIEFYQTNLSPNSYELKFQRII